MTSDNAAVLLAVGLLIASPQADPRGGRAWSGFRAGGFRHFDFVRSGFARAGRANAASVFSRDQSHSDDAYVKAASEEEDRVLKKLNSICRGC